MVFITEMWAFSSSGITVMTSWEQKVAVLDSSACSLLPAVSDALPLSAVALQPGFRTDPHPSSPPRWMLLLNSSSFSVSLSLNPIFYWQFPCWNLVFCEVAQQFPILASWPLLSSIPSPDGFVSQLFATFLFILAHKCQQSFLIISWLSHLLPSWSFLSSPLQGSAQCPAAHLSAFAPSRWQQCGRMTPLGAPAASLFSCHWAFLHATLRASALPRFHLFPVLSNLYLETVSPCLQRKYSRQRYKPESTSCFVEVVTRNVKYSVPELSAICFWVWHP